MSDKFTLTEIYSELLAVRDVVAWALVGVCTRVHLELMGGGFYCIGKRHKGEMWKLWETF